jgi:pimeloyl-ACP methyl ester carboxylesterase
MARGLTVQAGNDPRDRGQERSIFLPPGAEAFKRDNPSAIVHILDTGHFALETHVEEISTAIREFLSG